MDSITFKFNHNKGTVDMIVDEKTVSSTRGNSTQYELAILHALQNYVGSQLPEAIVKMTLGQCIDLEKLRIVLNYSLLQTQFPEDNLIYEDAVDQADFDKDFTLDNIRYYVVTTTEDVRTGYRSPSSEAEKCLESFPKTVEEYQKCHKLYYSTSYPNPEPDEEFEDEEECLEECDCCCDCDCESDCDCDCETCNCDEDWLLNCEDCGNEDYSNDIISEDELEKILSSFQNSIDNLTDATIILSEKIDYLNKLLM